MFDYEQIAERWNGERKILNSLGLALTRFIKTEITDYEILPEVTYRTKELLSIIKKIQKNLKKGPYTLDDLKDKLGLRIICSFSSDLEKVDQFIKENFIVEKADYKKDSLDF